MADVESDIKEEHILDVGKEVTMKMSLQSKVIVGEEYTFPESVGVSGTFICVSKNNVFMNKAYSECTFRWINT